MSDLVIGLEPWSDRFWSDARALAEAHFAEVDGGVELNRPFKLDERLMGLISDAGSLKIITARRGEELFGYFTWNITLDIESEGLLIGQQGAWYVKPGQWRAGVRMFDCSVAALKDLGVKCLFPHHRAQGRGSRIGRFFKRRGAKLIQFGYCLWIGD